MLDFARLGHYDADNDPIGRLDFSALHQIMKPGVLLGIALVIAWGYFSIPSNIPNTGVRLGAEHFANLGDEVIGFTNATGWPFIYESQSYTRGESEPVTFKFWPILLVNILEISCAMVAVAFLARRFLFGAKPAVLVAVAAGAFALYFIPVSLNSAVLAKSIHAAPIPIALLVWFLGRLGSETVRREIVENPYQSPV